MKASRSSRSEVRQSLPRGWIGIVKKPSFIGSPPSGGHHVWTDVSPEIMRLSKTVPVRSMDPIADLRRFLRPRGTRSAPAAYSCSSKEAAMSYDSGRDGLGENSRQRTYRAEVSRGG